MLLVVINHLPIPSHYYIFTVDRIGVVTGAELFVMISGFALGMVHRSRIEKAGWQASARSLWKRSLQIYSVIILVTACIWLLHGIGLPLDSLMSWTDPKTGQTFAAIPPNPLEHPMRSGFDLFRLRLTPPPINILGYFAVVSALAPFALYALLHRKAPLLISIGLSLYLLNFYQHWRITPAIFENPFPLLSWQLPFIAALVVGYYRRELALLFQKCRMRHTIIAAAATFVLLCLLFTWNNPWTNAFQYENIPHWARLTIIPPNLFDLIYAQAFGDRTWLFPARLLNAAAIIVAMYFILEKMWMPANRWLGWFFIPIGQASLYVFIMHLAFVALLSSPLFQNHRMIWNTLLHSFALLSLWAMVKTRFLFRWIPR